MVNIQNKDNTTLIAGAFCLIATFLWNTYNTHPLPSDVVSALQMIITFAVSKVTPHNP